MNFRKLTSAILHPMLVDLVLGLRKARNVDQLSGRLGLYWLSGARLASLETVTQCRLGGKLLGLLQLDILQLRLHLGFGFVLLWIHIFGLWQLLLLLPLEEAMATATATEAEYHVVHLLVPQVHPDLR